MKVSIHQANYFPYVGFFHKLSLSDIFVVMDDVQYQYDHTNRNKIVANNVKGWTRIIIPTKKEHKFSLIKDVEIDNKLPWRETNWHQINETYENSPFFNLYQKYLESLYKQEWTHLFAINLEIIKKIIQWLNIKTEIILESQLNVSGNSTERLVNVCKTIGADTYVSGMGGKTYLNEKLFGENKIKLVYQNYTSIIYPQKSSKSFIPNLSILDLLANMGSKSSQVIQNQKF